MRRLSLTILFIFLSCGVVFGGADTYTVSQTGAGTDFSIVQFNDSANWSATDNVSKIDPGDTVYFTGNLTTKIAPPQGYGGSAGGGYVTLDGYQAGSCDHSSGTLDANCINITTSGDYGIELDANTYLKIQDFRITNLTSSGIETYASDAGETLDHITFSRVGIEVATNGIFLTTPGGWSSATNVIIEDCTIKDIAEGDTSSAKGHLRLNKVNNLIIRRNYIFNNAGIELVGNGQDGMVLLDCSNILIEYNRVHHVSEDCIDYKHTSPSFPSAFGSVVIRFNDLYDALQSAITVQHEYGSYAYIYANRLHDIITYYPILIQRGFEHTYIWSNLIYDSLRAGIAMYNQDAARPVNDLFAVNNTIVGCGSNGDSEYYAAIRLTDSNGGPNIIKNNIYVNNNTVAYDIQFYVTADAASDTTANYNIHWLARGGSSKVYWNGTTYTLSDPVYSTSWYTASGQGFNSRMVDPALENLVGRDLRLTSSSTAAINAGQDLSQCFNVTVQGSAVDNLCTYYGLDPNNTNWSTTPPTVAVLNQNNYDSWEIGAYVYTTVPSSAPILTDTTDTPLSCPNGQDPLDGVLVTLTTDIPAYCRLSLANETWDAMTSEYAMSDGEGTTSHSDFTPTVACNQTFTVYVACSTSADDSGYESATSQIDVVIAAEEGISPPNPGTIYSDVTGKAQVVIHSDSSGKAQIVPY